MLTWTTLVYAIIINLHSMLKGLFTSNMSNGSIYFTILSPVAGMMQIRRTYGHLRTRLKEISRDKY